MASMSDIDLATLHKTRLEEKVNYKLSWLAHFNGKSGKLTEIVEKHKPEISDCDRELLAKSIEARDRLEFDNLSDDGYFSSDARRRRSGTWP